jgi:proteasome accessory factor A
VVTAPLAVLLLSALWLTAFVRIRRELTPFLVSRVVISGSGMLDDYGRFLLADKASAMNCLTGFGGLLGDRPIFCLGHFFKAVYADAWLAPQQYLKLFAARQRLQISLGDSNLADVAEYLRVGTTLLVLDVVEAGEMPALPRLRRPIRALKTVVNDSTLHARLPLAGGGRLSALEIQRFYLEACRQFLDRRPTAPAEARDIIHRWEIVLDALEDDPQSLVGTLDWVTKRFLLDKAGRAASWEARKKIDIRYHELSPQGYFQRLRTTGIIADLLTPAEIDHARRNPPAGTPASVRGRYIREFAADGESVTVNWQAVFLGSGSDGRVVRLDHCVPKGAAPKSALRKKSQGRKDSGDD